MSKPCFLKILRASLRTSPSIPGRISSRNSTTVTSAPSRRHTDPSSSPMTPPPMTTIDLGTLGRASAPVESTILCLLLSTSTPGSGVTDDPVAMTTFFAVTVRSPTFTLCASSNVAWPFSHSTLFFLNRKAMPSVRPLTAVSFDSCMVARSTSTPLVFTPHLARVPPSASSKSSDAWRSALDGMQPTLRQVPPRVSRLSAQAVLRPSWAARIAAT